MKKRLMVGLLSSGLLVAASVSPALAGPPLMLFDCSDGFEATLAGGSALDRNGNGQICLKFLQGGGSVTLKIVVTDDHPVGPRVY